MAPLEHRDLKSIEGVKSTVDSIEGLRSRLEKLLDDNEIDQSAIENCKVVLTELSAIPMTREILAKTKIGVYIAKLKKHESSQVRESAGLLVAQWKQAIDYNHSGTTQQPNDPPISSIQPKEALSTINQTPLDSKSMSGGSENTSSDHDATAEKSSAAKNSHSYSVQPQPKTGTNNFNASLSTPTNTDGSFENQSSGIDQKSSSNKIKGQDQSTTPPPKSYAGPLTQMQIRDKGRQFLYSGFINGVSQETLATFDINHVNTLIAQIEEETWNSHHSNNPTSSKAYTMQIKSIKWNLADIENPQFNLRIYSGELNPKKVAVMESKDMASSIKKLERKRQFQESLEACQSDWDRRNLDIKDGQFTCYRCKGKKTTYTQVQIRSADEPMTTFVTCISCNNRWKF